MAKKTTQLAVIGAGPGGYAAAFLAADLGMDVTLIDPAGNPGGTCLYRGCIPSKALLHVARQIRESQESRVWGVEFDRPRIRLNTLREWKNGVVSKLTGGLGQLVEQRRIHYVRGTATFRDNTSLSVDTIDGQKDTLHFENAIIAAGSRASPLPGVNIETETAAGRFMTATGALEIKEIPKKLLVIGGGYIGLEMGTLYASLGANVTVAEMTSTLLPGVDRDLVRVLSKRFSKLVKEVLVETVAKRFSIQKNGVKVTLESANGHSAIRLFDKVLMAVGRRPRSDDLGLENTGVSADADGFIPVDAQQRTAVATLYAVGDVVRGPMLAHKASHEGRIAAEVISGRRVVQDAVAIPAVVYTDPEIAWVGLTESQASKEKPIDYQAVRFPWAASGRALTLDRPDGLTKLIIDRRSERILGVGIVGTGAGELISEGALAMEMGANAADLGLTIHPHPTLSETVKEAADVFYGNATSIYRPRRQPGG